MKTRITLIILLFGLFACKNTPTKIDSTLGAYQIDNSKEKEWFVYSSVAEWVEFNAKENYSNTYDIYWYTNKSFDLRFKSSTNSNINLNSNSRIECAYHLRSNGKIVDKKFNNNQVKALLIPTSNEIFEDWIKRQNFSIKPEISQLALTEMLQLKNKQYDEFYKNSLLQSLLSFADFNSLMSESKTMFGDILWFKAKTESYQESKDSYSLDFAIGYSNKKTPLQMHLQWNKDFELINMGLLANARNNSAESLQLLKLFWTDVQRADWQNIYSKSSQSFQQETSLDQFTVLIQKLGTSLTEHNFVLASIEFDLQSFGEKWVYFYEYSKESHWVGINLFKNINSVDYTLDKMVNVE
jgi:hypothetical protein